MTLPAGLRLGPYEIECALGAGGMGEVYRARDTRLDRLVAIKILPEHIGRSPEFRTRFDREARAVAALTHPHICTLHDIGHLDGVDFLVMEYLDGRTLAEQLSKGAIPLDQTLSIAIDIGDALRTAHDHGIAHRDLKPGNIMLTDTGAKLFDFGLATRPNPSIASATAETIGQPAAALTKEGVILGTIGYMSPEQAAGQPGGAASDIFSFGVILYEMLTGRRAFARETAVETLAAILRDVPAPIPAGQLGEMSSMKKLVERCLSKDPSARYQNMRELTAELEEARASWIRSTSRSAIVPIVERRVITALAIEVFRAPDPAGHHSPERLKHVLDRAFLDLKALIEEQGGVVKRDVGGATHALFGAPVAHADDPQRALRAALACVHWAEASRSAPIPLVARAGVETGDAIVDLTMADGERELSVGACVTLAARLQQHADPGQVLIGPLCHHAVLEAAEFVELGELELAGIGAVPVWRLVSSVRPRRARLPLVGRDSELDLLRLAHRRAASGRSALALVTAPPGQGKSRLVEEFVTTIGDGAHVLQARCRPAGELGAQSPLLALLMSDGSDGLAMPAERLAAQLVTLFPDALERQRVLAALGHSAGLNVSHELAVLPIGQAQDEIANGWRRYLAALAREKPVVVWIDDLHWADAEIVELMDRLTSGSDIPLLVVATARPEFQSQRKLRAGGERFFVTLDKLDESGARRLAELASGAGASGIERAEGNPLFIIELARARAHEPGDVPVTLQGAIGARLDELPSRDRDLLQRAAVVGETFTVHDASLLSGRDLAEVSRVLDRLTDLLYLDPAPSGFRFHHALVRDVAYGRLTLGDRMRLHARYARDGIGSDDVEAVAHHLWEALGPEEANWVWEGSQELSEFRARARAAHLAAARRYADRGAYGRAIETCRRAFRFSTGSLDEARVEQTLAEVCSASGDADEGAAHYLQAREIYRTSGTAPPAAFYASFLEHPVYTSGMFRRPFDSALLDELLQEGEDVARRAGDTSSLARIRALRAYRSHDPAQLAEALGLSDSVQDPASLGSFLGHAAILQTRVGEFELARRTFTRLDAVAAAAGSIDPQLEFRAVLALSTGNLDEATRLAAQLLAANASRGPHLRTHAFREQGHVLLARGDWRALRDLAGETERLVVANPTTAFCYAVTTTRAFALLAQALEGAAESARALLPGVETPLQSEPFERESLLALVYGVLGRRDALSAVANQVGNSGATPMWFFLRNYAVALTMLESWDELESVLPPLDRLAARGSAYLDALLAAIREESAAARGGAKPTHLALQQLGYVGWSRLLAHRPTRA
jgi:serine/threonine protein kinase/tetratricopeptide (TPR) repeat protein